MCVARGRQATASRQPGRSEEVEEIYINLPLDTVIAFPRKTPLYCDGKNGEMRQVEGEEEDSC